MAERVDPMRFYVAAPMTDHAHWNIPAIDAAANDLRSRGHVVFSPAEMDDASFRELAFSTDRPLTPADHPTKETWGDLLARDVKVISDEVDAVAVLPGWRRSRGVRLETFVAFLCGKPVVYYPTLRKVPRAVLVGAWAGHVVRHG